MLGISNTVLESEVCFQEVCINPNRTYFENIRSILESFLIILAKILPFMSLVSKTAFLTSGFWDFGFCKKRKKNEN